jgi:predicted dehydrogenase
MAEIGVGIVGTGFGAQVHLPAAKLHPATRPVAIASLHRGRALQLAAEHGMEALGWEDLVEHPDVQLVVVASAPPYHLPIALTAIYHGKAVLLEKPMALDRKEAEALYRAALERGVVGAVHHEFRYFPARQEVARLLAAHELGEVLHVRWQATAGLGPRLVERPFGWLDDRLQGGGYLGAIGSHVIDSLLWWFGPIAEVTGLLATHAPRRVQGRATSDDGAFFLLRHACGVTGEVSLLMGGAAAESTRVEIHGSDGTLTLVDDEELWLARPGEAPRRLTLPSWQGAALLAPTDAPRLLRPALAFLDRLTARLSGEEVPSDAYADFRQGVAVQEVLDAVRASDQTGLRQRLAP